ncbi:hypothetical protein RvY_18664 [Ramazzottius varieornatus]|uniref:FAS1 domain-containing protein n=1 Tax=Ramazzottius varieornatus TaxID=947166 RepID=A0A1D1W6V0_RAMVA|nr:hypothetical protein RvY_18664 [Ramazzottius varieornatus]
MLVLLLSLCLGCVSAAQSPDNSLNIVDLARRLNANSFLAALDTAGLTDIVRGLTDVTVFVPSNAAFAALSQVTPQPGQGDPNFLPELLKFHIIKGLHPLSTLEDEGVYPTLAASFTGARFNIYNHSYMPDIKLYQGAVINQGNSNHFASNGIIHFLDQVVTSLPSVTTVAKVVSTPELSTLLALVQQTPEALALVNSDETPHTLFAPANAAITKLDDATRTKILTSPAYRKAVLLNHITQFGTYFSNGWIDGELVPVTNWTAYLLIKKPAGANILVNGGAQIVQPDVATSNGVIHVIDTVLLPRNPDGSLLNV